MFYSLLFFYIISFLVCLFGAIKTGIIYRKDRRNEISYNFVIFFILMSVMFIFLCLLVFVKDDLKAGAILLLIHGLEGILVCYLFRIITLCTYFSKLRNWIFWGAMLAINFQWLVVSKSFHPAEILVYKLGNFSFYSWLYSFPLNISLYLAVISIVISIANLSLFVVKVLNEENKNVRVRSYLWGLGMLAFGIHALGWYAPIGVFDSFLARDLIRGVFSVLGSGFLVGGFLYKTKN